MAQFRESQTLDVGDWTYEVYVDSDGYVCIRRRPVGAKHSYGKPEAVHDADAPPEVAAVVLRFAYA